MYSDLLWEVSQLLKCMAYPENISRAGRGVLWIIIKLRLPESLARWSIHWATCIMQRRYFTGLPLFFFSPIYQYNVLIKSFWLHHSYQRVHWKWSTIRFVSNFQTLVSNKVSHDSVSLLYLKRYFTLLYKNNVDCKYMVNLMKNCIMWPHFRQNWMSCSDKNKTMPLVHVHRQNWCLTSGSLQKNHWPFLVNYHGDYWSLTIGYYYMYIVLENWWTVISKLSHN